MLNPSNDLRIIFAGTPDFAAAHLLALIEGGFNVVSAYSQPDRPSGRGKKIVPTPVKAVAEKHGIEVLQPLSLTQPEVIAKLKAQAPDVIVVVAYGLLLPPEVLALPRFGCLNVHASLLPRWRGAAPIERAIMATDAETGICIMQMDEGLDTGAVLTRITTPISVTDTSQSLSERLVALGCKGLIEVLRQLPAGTLQAQPQDSQGITYAKKIRKEEALIQWDQPARLINAQIRALFPRSPAFSYYLGQRLRLLCASAMPMNAPAQEIAVGSILGVTDDCVIVQTGQGVLWVTQVQLEGKSPMSVKSLRNGHPDYFQVGGRFHNEPGHE